MMAMNPAFLLLWLVLSPIAVLSLMYLYDRFESR